MKIPKKLPSTMVDKEYICSISKGRSAEGCGISRCQIKKQCGTERRTNFAKFDVELWLRDVGPRGAAVRISQAIDVAFRPLDWLISKCIERKQRRDFGQWARDFSSRAHAYNVDRGLIRDAISAGARFWILTGDRKAERDFEVACEAIESEIQREQGRQEWTEQIRRRNAR